LKSVPPGDDLKGFSITPDPPASAAMQVEVIIETILDRSMAIRPSEHLHCLCHDCAAECRMR
jgi:hypothetical protein